VNRRVVIVYDVNMAVPRAPGAVWVASDADPLHIATALDPIQHAAFIARATSPGCIALAAGCFAPARHKAIGANNQGSVSLALFRCAVVLQFHCLCLLGMG